MAARCERDLAPALVRLHGQHTGLLQIELEIIEIAGMRGNYPAFCTEAGGKSAALFSQPICVSTTAQSILAGAARRRGHCRSCRLIKNRTAAALEILQDRRAGR